MTSRRTAVAACLAAGVVTASPAWPVTLFEAPGRLVRTAATPMAMSLRPVPGMPHRLVMLDGGRRVSF